MKRYQFLNLTDVNQPYLEEINAAVSDVISSGRYIGGEVVDRFERMMADITSTDCFIGTSNGFDALTLIFEGYKRLGILHDGDEVIVPANTYIASILAVWRAGLVPIAIDADIDTLNIDLNRIRHRITHRTKAILLVHLYGKIAFSDELAAVAQKSGILIIEDCAQAIGAYFDSPARPAGSLGDAAAFSFYPTKNVGAMGDAGGIATSDHTLANAVRALENYGSDRRYHNIYRGFNCRLDPIQAAILLVKLPHLREITAQRRHRADIYDNSISNDLLRLPIISDGDTVHQYVVLTPHRDKLRKYLSSNGVETDIHYPVAAIDQPCCQGYFTGDYEVTRTISQQALSLPIGQPMTDADYNEIAAIINRFSI